MAVKICPACCPCLGAAPKVHAPNSPVPRQVVGALTPRARVQPVHKRRCLIPVDVCGRPAAHPRARGDVGQASARGFVNLVLRNFPGTYPILVRNRAIARTRSRIDIDSVTGIANSDKLDRKSVRAAAKSVHLPDCPPGVGECSRTNQKQSGLFHFSKTPKAYAPKSHRLQLPNCTVKKVPPS